MSRKGEGVVWYTQVMTLLPPPSPFAETHKIEVGPPVFGQRQGWDGSPGWSTTASRGLLLETFRETRACPVESSSPGGKECRWRSSLELSDRLQGKLKLSHCDLDLPASETALSKPVLEESLLSCKLRSKLCSGTGLRQVSLGNPRSLDHSCLYIWAIIYFSWNLPEGGEEAEATQKDSCVVCASQGDTGQLCLAGAGFGICFGC